MDAIMGLKFTFDFGNRDEFHCVKVSKYGVFPGPYSVTFGLEKTPYLDNFQAVLNLLVVSTAMIFKTSSICFVI